MFKRLIQDETCLLWLNKIKEILGVCVLILDRSGDLDLVYLNINLNLFYSKSLSPLNWPI